MNQEKLGREKEPLTILPKRIVDMTIVEYRLKIENALEVITDSFQELTDNISTLREKMLKNLEDMNKKLKKPVSTAGLHRRIAKLEKRIKQYEEKGILR